MPSPARRIGTTRYSSSTTLAGAPFATGVSRWWSVSGAFAKRLVGDEPRELTGESQELGVRRLRRRAGSARCCTSGWLRTCRDRTRSHWVARRDVLHAGRGRSTVTSRRPVSSSMLLSLSSRSRTRRAHQEGRIGQLPWGNHVEVPRSSGAPRPISKTWLRRVLPVLRDASRRRSGDRAVVRELGVPDPRAQRHQPRDDHAVA